MSDFLDTLRAKFRERAATKADALRTARDAGDLAALQALGHDMAGSAGTFGFPDLSDLGFALEGAAEAGDAEAARQAADALLDALGRL